MVPILKEHSPCGKLKEKLNCNQEGRRKILGQKGFIFITYGLSFNILFKSEELVI